MTLTAPPSASHRRRRIIQVVVVIAIVLAITLPTWSWRAAVASAQVEVVPGLMTCDGKPMSLTAPGEEDEPGAPSFVIPIAKGMDCQFSVQVINHSAHTVVVKDMTFPALLPDEFNRGPMIIAGNDASQKPHARHDDIEAIFDVEESVAPDESISVDLRLRTNPNACVDAGTMTLRDLPSTRISVLHRQQTAQGSMAIAVKIATPLQGPDCENHS